MSRPATTSIVARKLWRYIFPPVNVKYSVFDVLLGAALAWIFGYVNLGIPGWGLWLPPWLAVLLVAIGDFVGEGVWQHGFDILYDRGGVSGFREDPGDPLVARLARSMVHASFIILVVIAIIMVLAGRLALIPVGVAAAILAWAYSRRRNECIPALAVALATAAGWFSVTNVPGPELIPAMVIGAMTAKLSLAFYRYDDYRGINTVADFPDEFSMLAYYRELFWIILWYPWLAMCIALYAVLPWWAPTIMSLLPLVEIAYRRRAFCHTSNH